jgi:RNA polymerase sigma-70 factor (ECF subfamily)
MNLMQAETKMMSDLGSYYEKYSADVFRFALYLTGNRMDAEDIVSETFVRLWTSSGTIRTETVKGLLFTIARNCFLKGLQHSSRHAPLDDEMADPAPGSDAVVEDRRQATEVFKAMENLPAADRAALVMRAMDELPYSEIACVLGISVVAAKVKVHRARAALMNLRRG